jgi:hypothetical protein
MDRRGYPPGQSFKNNFAAHEPAINSSSFLRQIQCLSLFLTPEEIVELSHQFRSCPDAELHRLATDLRRQCMLFRPHKSIVDYTDMRTALSLSESQRSSYLSNFSRQSMLSSSSVYSLDSASTDNCTIEQPTLGIEQNWQRSYPASQPGTQGTNPSSPFPPAHQVLHNQDSSYPTYAPPTQKPFCFACNEQFKNKGSLSRHQKEQCEREKISACSLCPLPQPMYYTKERLLRHHVTSHGDKCPNGCSKKENKISIPCKEHLSESFEKLPSKKAWGCPYCVSCFKTFKDWNEHCANHLRKADKVPKWCFGTMIWSLLQQDSLTEARMRHNIPETNWSSLNEKTCSGLREILEHCKIPSALRPHEYWYLAECDAVVRCVFDFIGSGQTLPSQQLFEVKSKPIQCSMPLSAGEGRKEVSCLFETSPAQGNPNKAIKTVLHSHNPADSATVTQNAVSKKVHCGPQPHYSPAIDNAAIVRSRPAETSDADETGNSQTRKRAPSLKRSLSALALRPSPSRSPAVQTMAVPPVPPLPGDAKTSNADKTGAGAHHDGDWTARPYLEPIPHYRPMSGVVYNEWTWSDGNQNQQ